MAEVTDVDIVLGVPTGGSGTVPTLSKTNTVIGAVNETAPASDTASSGLNGRLQRIAQRVTSLIAATLATSVADGSNVTLGAKADAKSTATDTTSITIMQVLKQVSASVQSLVTAIGSTAWDLGSGVIGSRTQRVALATDSPGVNATRTTAGTMANGFIQVGWPTDNGLPAAETHIGEVGGKSALRMITMTTDTGIYASGEVIADTQQYDAFFRKADGTGVINSITITEKDSQGAAYYILFHRTTTSMGTENAGVSITDANFVAGIQHIVAVATTDFVTMASSGTGSGTKVAQLKNLGLPVMAVSGTDDLYISIINSTGTPTYASGEIQLGIGVLLD